MKILHPKTFEYVYAAVSLLFAGIAWVGSNPWISGFSSWIAISFLLVALAYIFESPTIFRKSVSGRLPFFTTILLWPFLITAHVYNAIARRKDKVPPIQQVADGIFIARRLLPADVINLKQLKISAVLDVTAEFNAMEWSLLDKHVDYLNIPVLDHQAPARGSVIKGINWINRHRNKGHSVLIHCALGRGRSVFMGAAYLLAKNKQRTVREVLSQINSKRQSARLNTKQLRALQEIANRPDFKIMPNAWLIANPVSGGGKWQEHKYSICDQLQLFYSLTVKITSRDTDAKQLTREALSCDADLLIACGGDGTVNEVIAEAKDTDIPVGIVPLGTTNALSHALWGLEAKVSPVNTACEQIIHGLPKHHDLGVCNDEVFSLVLGIGFESKMIELADREQKDELGQFAYIGGLVQAIQEDESHTLEVQFNDDKPQFVTVKSLVVANAAPLFTLLAQGGGEPDSQDGMLDVTILKSDSEQANHLRSLFDLLTASTTAPNNPAILHRQCTRLTIKSEDTLSYVIDGELRQASQLEVSVMPEAIRLISAN